MNNSTYPNNVHGNGESRNRMKIQEKKHLSHIWLIISEQRLGLLALIKLSGSWVDDGWDNWIMVLISSPHSSTTTTSDLIGLLCQPDPPLRFISRVAVHAPMCLQPLQSTEWRRQAIRRFFILRFTTVCCLSVIGPVGGISDTSTNQNPVSFPSNEMISSFLYKTHTR